MAGWAALLLAAGSGPSLCANPSGGTVAKGGAATFTTSGSQFTINQTSANAFIQWQSFDIGSGETTTFVQPSSSSVTWNQINSPNASQILGNLNANGYVVLQNAAGFNIGGNASIKTRGLIMTTASTPTVPDLSGGGPWEFDAPPPTASIINHGQIIGQGGSVFLISYDIQNQGTISAPQVGLYAGQQVLVSERPDGRALSAKVTLPQGSVDNEGAIIADAGTIAMQAQTVNQGGVLQANSAQVVNGVIELVASDSLKLGANSVISAQGDATSPTPSPGGFVVLKSGNTFSDAAGSSIQVAGSAASGVPSGQNGIVEIFGNGVDTGTIKSSFDNPYALLVNPFDITLGNSTSLSDPSAPSLNVNDLSKYSKISLFADDSITLNSVWSVSSSQDPLAAVSLEAANDITLNNGATINAGNNRQVNLTAGTELTSAANRQNNTDGIYLNGNAYIQSQNGDINLSAGSDVLVNSGSSGAVGNNGIRTLAGGNIDVTAEFGDVNSGGNTKGFDTSFAGYKSTAPYYSVSSTLGGISTAAGGNVTIQAGGNVTAYLPNSGSGAAGAGDAGSGAFGANPGNVTITAGGSVLGHYVVANGLGTITAGKDAGNANQNIALSLIKGGWSVNAPNGNIYLQEVRNPNGTFNKTGGVGSGGHHLFDYDPQAFVDLNAGIGVYLTCLNLPRPNDPVSVIFPSILDISAGSGGITLEGDVILFPSAYEDLQLSTTGGGNLVAIQSDPNKPLPSLIMSDSAQTRWTGVGQPANDTFGLNDHSATPVDLDSPNPAIVNISGSMDNLSLYTTKQTDITVGGDMINCSFSGQNLKPGDVTSIDVKGQIFNRSPYTFVNLDQGIQNLSAKDLPQNTPSTWNTLLSVALDPVKVAALAVPQNLDPSQWAAYVAQQASIPIDASVFYYDPSTKRLGFSGTMSPAVLAILEQPLTVLRYGPDGLPVTQNGHFVTDTVSWLSSADIQQLNTLYTESHDPLYGAIHDLPLDPNNLPSVGAPGLGSIATGYLVGGPGQFNVTAGSMELGNSGGIITSGVGDPSGHGRYANLATYTKSGASIDVNVAGDLDMLTSTIAALAGGNVDVTCGGSMDLGSTQTTGRRPVYSLPAFGIYTTGSGGNVSVTAVGDININGSRIAAYNGGSVDVTSLQGNVNAGNGGAVQATVYFYYVDPVTGLPGFASGGIYGSGILATTFVNSRSVPGAAKLPGNITVTTPEGDIIANQGGILQEALNGNVSAGPTITLRAGTFPSGNSKGFTGNIDLGKSGVIGGAVDLQANGNITGLIISRQNTTIDAAQSFSGTVLSGGSATLSAGGSISGTVIGVGGISASGGQGITATLLSQNVSVSGAQAQSTLGTATATSASQSAAQQSSSETQQQIAMDTSQQDDDDQKKKGKPSLTHRTGRVTVILPKAM